jgi:predicted nucleic acid-binding protein
MTLIDTSIWIDHFQRNNAALVGLLEAGEAGVHPMVLGELACGGLPTRGVTLELLRQLPVVAQCPDGEVFEAVEKYRWWQVGIGWVDAHLLTSALVSDVPLLTLDRRLAASATALRKSS